MKTALAALLLLAAPGALAQDPANIRPTAHASPSAPPPRSFEGGALPPGHPSVDGLPPGHPSAESLPPGHPQVANDQMDSKQLLEKLDAMKDQLKDRPKTAEIEYALGNLYYENARYPDAIDEYRHLLERAKGPLARWVAARAHPHRDVTPDEAGCPAAGHPSFDQLIAKGDARAAAADWSSAVTCYEAALLPIVVAKARRANAFFLVGNADRAVQEHREVLALEPEFDDSLFFLGAILYETGDGDAAQLQQAKDAWTKYLATKPEAERAKLVRQNLAKIDRALRNGGHLPQDRPEGGGAQMAGLGEGPIAPPPPPPELAEQDRRALRAAVAEGDRLSKERRWADALAAFDRARKFDRGDPDAATGAGIALLNLGERGDAETAFRDALGRDPKHGLALYELGEVFFENEHYAGATRFWTQLREQDPELAHEVAIDKRLEAAEARSR